LGWVGGGGWVGMVWVRSRVPGSRRKREKDRRSVKEKKATLLSVLKPVVAQS